MNYQLVDYSSALIDVGGTIYGLRCIKGLRGKGAGNTGVRGRGTRAGKSL